MAFTPVIVPVTTTRDCIVQDGVRYCESHPMTPHDVGMIGLVFIGVIFWALTIGYCLVERDRSDIAIVVVFAPFVVMAVWGLLL